MIKRLLCALRGHSPTMTDWLLATGYEQPIKRSLVVRLCTTCGVYVAASG